LRFAALLGGLCIPTVQLEDVLSEEGRWSITMRKVDGPSSRTPAAP
jgi:hypothetical protein